MCRYISFFFNDSAKELPDVRVACLYSHGLTEIWLGLDPAGPYTEGHYLPNGEIECRLPDGTRSVRAEDAIRAKWPTFKAFETWAWEQTAQYYANGYDISGFDREGYNRGGYNIEGYDRNGLNRDGYDRQGYNWYGFAHEDRPRK